MAFSFKAMVEADRRRTFLNLDEFGEKHTVEGRAIAAVLDDNALKLDDQTILVADIQSSFLRQHSLTRGVWTLTIWTKTPQRLAGVAIGPQRQASIYSLRQLSAALDQVRGVEPQV